MYDEIPRDEEEERRRQEEIDRKALMMQMQTEPPTPSQLPSSPPYSLDGDGKQPPKVTGEAPPTATQLPTEGTTVSSAFQSNNPTVRGYIDAAVNSYAPTVQGLAGEAARKQKIQEYLQSLVPEIQKRGGVVGDIKNEKIMIDGQWVDVLRDIEGAAAPQYLVESGDGGGNTPSALNALSLGNLGEFGGPGTSLPTDAGTYQDLMRRIQEILGEESIDKQALLTQMKR